MLNWRRNDFSDVDEMEGLKQLRKSLFRRRTKFAGTLAAAMLPALVSLWGLASPGLAQQTGRTEYQVKAAYLFNFAKFVEWPEHTFASPDTPLEICVLGVDPFGQQLEESIAGKTVDGRRLEIFHTVHVLDARSCQILFIAISEKRQIRQILQQLNGSSILTVSDMPSFTDEGGMISFIVEGERVRFEANTDAAEQGHLVLSARLLSVAKTVTSKSQAGKH